MEEKYKFFVAQKIFWGKVRPIDSSKIWTLDSGLEIQGKRKLGHQTKNLPEIENTTCGGGGLENFWKES